MLFGPSGEPHSERMDMSPSRMIMMEENKRGGFNENGSDDLQRYCQCAQKSFWVQNNDRSRCRFAEYFNVNEHMWRT